MRWHPWRQIALLGSGAVAFQATGTCSPEVLNAVRDSLVTPLVDVAIGSVLLGDDQGEVGIPPAPSVFDRVGDQIDHVNAGLGLPEAPASGG
jgi:hypothetical protein